MATAQCFFDVLENHQWMLRRCWSGINWRHIDFQLWIYRVLWQPGHHAGILVSIRLASTAKYSWKISNVLWIVWARCYSSSIIWNIKPNRILCCRGYCRIFALISSIRSPFHYYYISLWSAEEMSWHMWFKMSIFA